MLRDIKKAVRVIAFLMLTISVFLMVGCASSQPQYEIVKEPGPVVLDIQSPADQALEAVINSPTTFYLPTAEDFAAVERARTFLNNYTKSGLQLDAVVGGTVVLSNVDNSKKGGAKPDRFVYQIERSFQNTKKGPMAKFRVSCKPRVKMADGRLEAVTPEQLREADMNAKNFARFVRAGELELALLNE
jgi:hypothetical protein